MKLKIKITKKRYEDLNVRYPWYMGYSYTDYLTNSRVYWIVPINVIVSFYLYASNLLRWRLTFKIETKLIRVIHPFVFEEAWIRGYQTCLMEHNHYKMNENDLRAYYRDMKKAGKLPFMRK